MSEIDSEKEGVGLHEGLADTFKLEKHSLQYFLSKILPSLFMLVGIVFFVRIAGKEEYGKYSLLFSTIMFLLTFTSGWINQVILRFHSEYSHAKENYFYLSSIILGSIISYAVGQPLLLAAINSLPATPRYASSICSIIYVLAFAYGLKNTFLQARLAPSMIIKNEIMRSAILLIAPLLLYLYLGLLNSTILLVGTALAYLAALLTGISVRGYDLREFLNKRPGSLKPYLLTFSKYGIPLSLWFAAAYLLNVTDRYLIGYFLNYENVGIYSAVYDLVYKAISIALFPVLMAAHPLIINNWVKNRQESRRILRKALKYQAIIFPFALFVVISTSPVFSTMLRIDMSLILGIGIPVAAGAFLWQFSMLLHKPLEINNKTFLMFNFVLIALIVNVTGNIIFIPVYGIVAAAYTTVAGALVYNLLIFFQFRKHMTR